MMDEKSALWARVIRSEFAGDLLAFFASFATPKRLALFDRILSSRTRYLTLALEHPANPNDAAAVLRSCECHGIQDVALIADAGGFKASPGVVVGSSKWLTTQRYPEMGDGLAASRCARELESRGYALAVLGSDDSLPSLTELPLDQKLALWLGAEGIGADREVIHAAQYHVRLPSHGFSKTLNLSVCAAVCLSHLRRRLHESSINWRLTESEKLQLKLQWLIAMRRRPEKLLARFLEERKLGVEALGLE